MPRIYYFTIGRRPGAAFLTSLPTVQAEPPYERTIVGRTGQRHMKRTHEEGRGGHFSDEGSYRRAIEAAVQKNGG